MAALTWHLLEQPTLLTRQLTDPDKQEKEHRLSHPASREPSVDADDQRLRASPTSIQL
jgi:hypothetical protein